MSKRRTKKDKEKVRHQSFRQPEPQNVKGQIENDISLVKAANSNPKNVIPTAKDEKNVSVKRDLVKSLILVSLILALELVLYLAVNK